MTRHLHGLVVAATRVAGGVLLAGFGLAAGDGGLAPNPGFEEEDGGAPAFWERRTGTDAMRSLEWDGDVRRSGARSLRITNRAETLSRWRTGHLADIALAPETPFTFSGWIKTDGVEGSAHLLLYCMDADGGILAQAVTGSVSGTTDWTEVRLSRTTPQDTAYVLLYLQLKGTGTAWFDDVALAGRAAAPQAKLKLPTFAIAPTDFELIEGFGGGTRLGKRVIGLSPEARAGRARAVFWGRTARYEVTISHFDENDGAGRIRLLVNGREAAALHLDRNLPGSAAESVLMERVVPAVDIQRLSRIVIEGRADNGEYCRVHRLTFRPTGRFQGTLMKEEDLRLPPSLFVFDNPAERLKLHGALAVRMHQGQAAKWKAREQELAGLKTPADWRARQERVRARLSAFFGEYGPKCPLKPRITGRIERSGCVIEKLVFESQPGYYCTANVYVPRGRRFPVPGVLVTCGHAGPGKAYDLYHECGLGLARKGCLALALDPMGQGERSEYFDAETGEHLVPLTVAQHHHLSRPSWLVGRSLSGHRTWDCIRAVDYLTTRPEVDRARIGVVGNSGGGQMALLITAADERVAVCAAAHPGGSQENTYLRGQSLIDRDILSLIPPRPCVFIVGEKSGEAPGHRLKLNDMLRFYRGLGADEGRGAFELVDGVHDLKAPKRVVAYAWFNKWFGREEEGADEPALAPETIEALNCTESGFTLKSLGGESGQRIVARIAEELRPPRECPRDEAALAAQLVELRERIGRRLGFEAPADRAAPGLAPHGTLECAEFGVEKLTFESEPRVRLPGLLLRPRSPAPNAPVILHASQWGKPTKPDAPSLALSLVRRGFTVFSIDARGSGETDPRQGQTLREMTQYDPLQWRVDSAAVSLAYADTTALALRAFDLIRALDALQATPSLADRPVALVGEELAGLWALVAAAFDPRPVAVCCVRMTPSYKLITGSQYYKVRDYFWVASALMDYDIPDLPALAAPRPVALIDPVDALLEPLDLDACRAHCRWASEVYALLGAESAFRIMRTGDGARPDPEEQAEAVGRVLSGVR